MSNVQSILASKVVLMFRDLDKKDKEDASMLIFQTQHQIKDKAKTNTIETKTGTIVVPSSPEITLSFSYYESQDPKIKGVFRDFIRDCKTIEIWMIDMNEKKETNPDGSAKYEAEYSRGVISDVSASYKVADAVECDVEVAINGRPQKGLVTLNPKMSEKVNYVFEAITKGGK